MKLNEKPNIEILKEPKGFIKGIELIITIFAFSLVAGFIGRFAFDVKCKGNPASFNVHGDFPYPFDDVKIYATSPNCQNMSTKELNSLSEKVDYQSDAQYFVFTGVTSMLFVLVATGYYVFFEDRARDATSTDVGLLSFPVVDFVFTILLVVFWFTSSIAWAAAVSGLRNATNQESVFKNYVACTTNPCESFEGASYGAPVVAVLLGFLNVFVWGGNLWFLFKETPWHSPRSSGVKGGEIPQQDPPHQDTPSAI